MRILLKDKRGVSLLFVLILGIICLLLVGVVYKLIGAGARVSGAVIRYESTLEAAKSAALITEKLILAYWNQNIDQNLNFNDSTIHFKDVNCLKAKIERVTEEWANKSYAIRCSSIDDARSGQQPSDIKEHYDLKVDCGNYVAYVKIIDTKLSPVTERPGVALTGVAYSRWSLQDVERVYTVHVVAEEKKLFNKEKSWVTFLYAVGPGE